MCACDISRDGQSQAHTAGLQIASFVEAVEGPKRFVTLIFRDARSVVVDMDISEMRFVPERNAHMPPMLEGVVDQIGSATAQRIGLHRQ